MADQERFAQLSGDRNPLHLDPVAARRTQAGEPAVHGMHALLWALDRLAAASPAPIARLRVRFRKFILLDRTATLALARTAPGARASITVDGLTTTMIEVAMGSAAWASAPVQAPRSEIGATPVALGIDALAGVSGRVEVPDGTAFARLFPDLARTIGARRVAALARLSAVVGMICPGLHAIFDGLDLVIAEETEDTALGFKVEKIDYRFRLAKLRIAGAGLAGTLTAIVRHPPVEQPALADLRAHVGGAEFAGVSALVIGGSRGLGAVTARLLAAGGARVAITFMQGEAEARAIAEEIGGAQARTLRFDASAPAAAQLAGLEWPISQLYYFATPRIFRQKGRLYSPALFAEFCALYGDGFEAACTALLALARGPLAAFYPSSVAVAERPPEMTEYAMAKAAGEILCADLQRATRGLVIHVARLPRVVTDQTIAGSAEGEDAAGTMLPILRAMTRAA